MFGASVFPSVLMLQTLVAAFLTLFYIFLRIITSSVDILGAANTSILVSLFSQVLS